MRRTSMRIRLAVGCASIAAALTLTGCLNGTGGGRDVDGTTSGSNGTGSNSGAHKPNTDKEADPLFAKTAPCSLLTDADLYRLFRSKSFSHQGGTAIVDDFQGRQCNFTAPDAQSNDGSRYSIVDVSIIVRVQLDNNGTLWDAWKSVVGNSPATIPGANDAIKVEGAGDGWFQAKRGRVVVEVQDLNGNLKDADTMDIIRTMFVNLSKQHL